MSRALGSASPKLRLAAATAAFATLYFLVAALTDSLVGDPGIAVMWPASGVYLGVMLAAPRQMWPALACAAGIGSLAGYLHAGSSLEVSVAFAVPSSAEGLLGALLVERIAGRRLTLGGLRDLTALVVGSVLVATALVALSAGVIAAKTFGASFAESWLRWWSADALGVIAVAPLIAGPLRTGRRRPSRRELREAALMVAGVGLAVCVALWSEPGGAAILAGGAIALPFVLWAGWRWGTRAAALGGLAVALVATHLATQVYAVQAFLAVLLLGSLAFAAAVGEQRRAETAAAASRRRLRRIVDSSPDAYLAVDADGRIAEWSASAEAMFGWDAEHVVGRSPAETIAPGATLDGSTLELVVRDRSGRQFPVRLSVAPASERDDGLRHIFVHDVAERERVREELETTAGKLEDARGRIDKLTAELAARGRELERAGRERERLAEDLHAAQEARRRTEAELGTAGSALAAAEHERERLGREVALAVAGRDSMRSELDDSARELGCLRAELADGRDELARATARSQALAEEIETARAEQARTADELAGATSERRRVEQELEQARARSAEEQERLERSLEEAQAGFAEERQRLERSLQEARARFAEEQQRRERSLQEARARFAGERQRLETSLEQARLRSAEERERTLQQARAGFAEDRASLERSLEEAAKSRARAEAECRLLGEHASEGIASYDQRGTCLYASPAFRGLLGYEPEELVGRPGAELLHADDRHRLARARATRSASTFEARLRRRDGDFVWVEVSLLPVLGRGDELIAMNTTIRDISEKRAAGESRRLAQAGFDSLFATLPSGSALLTPDGRVDRANSALCRLTGYSRERLERTSLTTIVRREDAGPCSAGLRRVASGELASLRLEQQLVQASGRTVAVELSVTQLDTGGLVAHFRELTERTRAREEIRRFSPGQTPPRQTAA